MQKPNLNLSNKVAVLPQVNATTGRSLRRNLVDTQTLGQKVASEWRLVETVENKEESEKVRNFVSKVHQAFDALTSPAVKGLRVVDASKQSDVEALTSDLAKQASELTSSLTTCGVTVDCVFVPVQLDVDERTADLLRKEIHSRLTDIKTAITQPDTTKTAALKYAAVYQAVQRAKNLPALCSGVHADAVVAALEEAASQAKVVRKGDEPTTTALENAISLFEATETQANINFEDWA